MNQRSIRILIAIMLVSVAARVAVAFYLGDVVDAPALLTDQRSYHALGERLITGHGFSFATGWYPFTPADTPTAHWSFLYSLFVAVVYGAFGVHPLAVRIVQAILGGILLPWMVYRLSRRLFEPMFDQTDAPKPTGLGSNSETLALLAAGLAAIYFYFILYAATLMTETFFIVALLWSLERASVLAERPTCKVAVAFGISLGVATLLRQSILPWIAVLATWLLWTARRSKQLRRMIGSLALSMGLLALAILPFTLRNYSVYGEFLLLNSNAGYAMYSAQNPMHGTEFQAFVGAPLPDDLHGMNEAQMDRELMRRGIGFVLADPGRYVLLSLSRVSDYFEFWPTSSTDLINNVGRVGSIGLFLPFMLAGLWLALRRAGPRTVGGWRQFLSSPLALIGLFMVFYSLLHILTWAIPRYRLPVDAVALPFAALALYELVRLVADRLRKNDKRLRVI